MRRWKKKSHHALAHLRSRSLVRSIKLADVILKKKGERRKKECYLGRLGRLACAPRSPRTCACNIARSTRLRALVPLRRRVRINKFNLSRGFDITVGRRGVTPIPRWCRSARSVSMHKRSVHNAAAIHTDNCRIDLSQFRRSPAVFWKPDNSSRDASGFCSASIPGLIYRIIDPRRSEDQVDGCIRRNCVTVAGRTPESMLSMFCRRGERGSLAEAAILLPPPFRHGRGFASRVRAAK